MEKRIYTGSARRSVRRGGIRFPRLNTGDTVAIVKAGERSSVVMHRGDSRFIHVVLNDQLSETGAVVTTDNRTPAEIVAAEKFTWPGGYEMFAVTDDGAVLCFKCCENEARTIRESDPGDGWHVIGLDATCNTDAGITCDHCYRVIQEEWEYAKRFPKDYNA